MPRHDPIHLAVPFPGEAATADRVGSPGPGARARGAPAAPEDPVRLSDPALVALVVREHHAYARRALPYLVALLGKVTARYRGRNPKLAALCDAGEELAEALETCLEVQERELFPALATGAPASEGLRRELDAMYRRQREMRLLLVRIRWLADDFAAPAWGDRSYQVLMEELEALEANLLEHIHLERVVLGPRLSSLCAGAPDPVAAEGTGTR